MKLDEGIMREIERNYVPVFLYVDDRTKLEKEKKVVRNGKTISLRTKGNEWGHIELTQFNKNIQPLIVIIDSTQQILKKPLEGQITRENVLRYLQE